MLSDRKLHANRLNAQKSTGPRTAEGKSRSALNALKTGLFSGKTVVLPGESQADYDALRDALLESVDQNDPFEMLLAERMVAARWKLARLSSTERRAHSQRNGPILLSHLCRDDVSGYEQRLENQIQRAIRELRQWRAEKRKAKNEATEEREPSIDTNQTPVSERSEEPDLHANGENEPTAMCGNVQECSVPREKEPNEQYEPTAAPTG